MEDILDTIKRVNDVWEAAENKLPLVESFGFPTEGPAFLNWVGEYTTGTYVSAVSTYVSEELAQGYSKEDALIRGTAMAMADAAIVFMMLGRERERLSSLDAPIGEPPEGTKWGL